MIRMNFESIKSASLVNQADSTPALIIKGGGRALRYTRNKQTHRRLQTVPCAIWTEVVEDMG